MSRQFYGKVVKAAEPVLDQVFVRVVALAEKKQSHDLNHLSIMRNPQPQVPHSTAARTPPMQNARRACGNVGPNLRLFAGLKKTKVFWTMLR